MIHVNYVVAPIADMAELDGINRNLEGFKQYKKNFKDSLRVMWNSVNEFLKPGVSQDGSIGLIEKISIETDDKEKEDDFGKVILKVSEEIFREKCVLSCTTECSESDAGMFFIATVIVLPIPKRVVDPYVYMNEHTKQLADKYKAIYENGLNSIFDNVYITGVTLESSTEKDLGYKKALLDYVPMKYNKALDHEEIYQVSDSIQTELPVDKIKKISNDLISRFKTGVDSLVFEQAQYGKISKMEVRKRADQWLKDNGYTTDTLTINDYKVIMKKFYSAMYGNYILDPLIADDKISDIMILDPNKIRVKALGKRYTSNIKFLGTDDYLKFCEGIAVRNNLDLIHKDVHVFSDPASSDDFYLRLNLTTAGVNTNGFPAFQIRKIAKHKRDWEYLIKAGMIDEVLKNYLIDRARTARGIIFCGKGASGKTTLMNVMLDCIPFNKSVEVMQESIELFSKVHPHIDFKQITERNSLETLARNGLLTDLDYYVIGETKGKEAAYLAMAVDSGHKGWTSVHASSAREGIIRLTDYVMMGTDYNQEQAVKQLLNMDTLIYLQDFKVCEIYQIAGWDKDKKEIIFDPVYIRPGISLMSAI